MSDFLEGRKGHILEVTKWRKEVGGGGNMSKVADVVIHAKFPQLPICCLELYLLSDVTYKTFFCTQATPLKHGA